MNDYDILASESQERMLIVSNVENRDFIFEIFEKWDLEYAVIGTVTDDGNYTVVNNGVRVFTKDMEEFDNEWMVQTSQGLSLSFHVFDLMLPFWSH